MGESISQSIGSAVGLANSYGTGTIYHGVGVVDTVR